MFLVNSRLGLFTAAPSPEHPFSRSYGVILPSSLTIVLSLALGFSPHLPVSVCGTGTSLLHSGFSRQREIGLFGTQFPPRHRSSLQRADLPTRKTFCLDTQPTVCTSYPSASPPLSNEARWCRNLNLLSIAYSSRSRLRPRLTLRGRTFLRKPKIFGGKDSHLAFATHANILTRMQSTMPYDTASARMRRSSTIPKGIHSFGSKFEPRLSSAQSHSTSELLRTL